MNYFKITDNHKIKTSELLEQCKKLFSVYYYCGDKIDKEFPRPKKTTIRYFKKVIEADEDLKNLSADDLEKKGIQGITLRERLIMELDYFKETGNHLDIINWTLCSGSRNSVGHVPYVSWGGSRLQVLWDDSYGQYDNLRSRVVVPKLNELLNYVSREEFEEFKSKVEKVIKL